MHQLSRLFFVFLVDADLERFLRFLENLFKKKKKGIHRLTVRFHATSDDHCGKKKKQLIRTSVLAHRLSFNAVHTNTIVLDKHAFRDEDEGRMIYQVD